MSTWQENIKVSMI